MTQAAGMVFRRCRSPSEQRGFQVAAGNGVRDVHCFLPSFVNFRGVVVETGEARDVAGDDAGRDVHGDLPGSAVRLVSQVVVAMGQAAF
jgi:hypothetical protein